MKKGDDTIQNLYLNKAFFTIVTTKFPKILANTNYRYFTYTWAFCFLITDYESKDIIFISLQSLRENDRCTVYSELKCNRIETKCEDIMSRLKLFTR